MEHYNLSGKRIVICEDEGITVMQLERGLARAGLVVVGKAGNGQEILDLVLRERPDIVLLDIVMPGQNGLDSLAQIMTESPTCVVMVTANSDTEYMGKARELGATGYIAKPISAEYLLPALQNALQMFYECNP